MICTRVKTGTNRCERCGDSPTTGFFCTDIPAELHTEKFTASDALLCAVCAGEQDPERVGDTTDIMMSFVPGEAQDILYMLTDYIQTMEDKLSHLGDPEDDSDKQYQEEEQANLAVAIRLYEKLEKELVCIRKDEQQAKELAK